MRRLLPKPMVPPPKAAPIPSDRELLIQCLLGAILQPQPVIQERSQFDGYGNCVTELASGRISHGGGRVFVGASSGVSGGVFFLWGVDPHNGPMSDAMSRFRFCRWDGRRTALGTSSF